MKKILLIIPLVFYVLICPGQKINKAEYFIDNDPGFGLATPIPVSTPANDVSLSFQVNTGGFPEGFHMMVLRARDENKHWSTSRQQVFYIYKSTTATSAKINKAEYFIDTDPGIGLATPIPVSVPAKDLSLSFGVNTSGLAQGFHMIVLRARDEPGRWSVTRQQVFYIYKSVSTTAAKMTKAEYFIDTDPGIGKAFNIPIAVPSKDVSLSFNVNTGTLPQGFHMMVIRARDEKGYWSNTRQQVFYLFKAIPATSVNITGIEYFIDTDPGYGKGKVVNVAVPGKDITADFLVNLADVTSGNHILYIRAKDAEDRWSNNFLHAFSVILSAIGEKEITPWFRMYPNPNQGNFVIDFSELRSSSVRITISDLNGRIIYSNELVGEIIPLSVNIPDGIYMLKAESGSKFFMQKLIIRR